MLLLISLAFICIGRCTCCLLCIMGDCFRPACEGRGPSFLPLLSICLKLENVRPNLLLRKAVNFELERK